MEEPDRHRAVERTNAHPAASHGPAGESEADVRRAYRVFAREQLRRAAPPALLLLMSFAVGSGAIELWYFPDRWLAMLLLNAGYLSCSLAHVAVIHLRPQWTVGSSIVASAVVYPAVVAYFTLTHGSAELCVVVVVALLTAQVILHPWSATTQFFASMIPVAAYLVGLWGGLQSELPRIYPTFTLLTMVMLTSIGARRLEQQGFEAFRRARELERAVSVQRREHAFSEALLDLARALNVAIGDPQRLAGELAEHTRVAMGVDWVLVHRAVDEGQAFRLAAAAGVPTDLLEEFEAIGSTREWMLALAAEIARHGAAEVLRSDQAAMLPPAILDRWGIRALRVQSVAGEERRVGVITCASLAREGPFTEDQRRFLGAIATQAAVALENAGLVEASRTADRVKSEFVATVSHELRTPLNIIVGYTDLILDHTFGECTGGERDALERLRQQSLQLLDLIQGILDLNRLESRGVTLDLQRFSVRELMESLREGIPSNWARPEVAVRWDPGPVGATLRSDRGKLEIVLRNLVHNALKFTSRGHVAISAEVPEGGGVVRFRVADTGPGIPASELSLIFEMFGQGEVGPRGGGVGLGLHIVKRLLDALGGTIAVTSERGQGARFTVTLPIEPD